jgi:hypothetical protein
MKKEIKSVANITRKDVEKFLHLAAQIPIKPKVELYSLDRANNALLDLKQKTRTGKALVMPKSWFKPVFNHILVHRLYYDSSNTAFICSNSLVIAPLFINV